MLRPYELATPSEIFPGRLREPAPGRLLSSPARDAVRRWAEHMCVGRKLARLELRIALHEFVNRFASLEVVEDPRYLRTNQAVSIKSMRVVVGG
jgi:cytochrome P450